MRIADVITESDNICSRYRYDPYEFATDIRHKLIDPKKAGPLIVEWLTDSMTNSLGMFLNDFRILSKATDLKKYPAVRTLINSHKTAIVTAMLKMLKEPVTVWVPDQTSNVQMIMRDIRAVGLEWPEFAAIERSINSKQLKENEVDINDLSEPEQVELIKRRPIEFTKLKNPSEAAQIAVVKKSPFTIEIIDNPSEAVQLAAVRAGCASIQYIENPTERVQLTAVKKNGMVLQYIDNPNDRVIEAALKNEPYALQYLENPTDQQKMTAVSTNGAVIYMIENPSEELIRAAVASNPRAIESINNPPLDLQISALSREYVSIFHMRSIDNRVFNHPDVKRRFMQEILTRVKRDPDDVHHVGIIMHVLKKNGVDWPELNTVKRSVPALR